MREAVLRNDRNWETDNYALYAWTRSVLYDDQEECRSSESAVEAFPRPLKQFKEEQSMRLRSPSWQLDCTSIMRTLFTRYCRRLWHTLPPLASREPRLPTASHLPPQGFIFPNEPANVIYAASRRPGTAGQDGRMRQ